MKKGVYDATALAVSISKQLGVGFHRRTSQIIIVQGEKILSTSRLSIEMPLSLSCDRGTETVPMIPVSVYVAFLSSSLSAKGTVRTTAEVGGMPGVHSRPSDGECLAWIIRVLDRRLECECSIRTSRRSHILLLDGTLLRFS